jgi:hypothetical protein
MNYLDIDTKYTPKKLMKLATKKVLLKKLKT